MADIGLGPFTGHGYRIYLDQEERTEANAQALTLENYKKTNGGQKRAEPTVGQLVSNGWGLLLQETLQKAGAQNALDDVLQVNAYNLGPNGEGGNYWLVPVSRYYDPGKASRIPRYRGVNVFTDMASQAELQARQDRDRLLSEQRAKQAQLDVLQEVGASGDIDRQLAIARGKAGQGIASMELTIIGGGSVFTAQDDSESGEATGPHPGKSVIMAGAWEMLAGQNAPGKYGLPKALIAANRPDGSDAHIASQEYQSCLAVARTQPAGGGLGNIFGLPQPAARYSDEQIVAAQQALLSLNLTW